MSTLPEAIEWIARTPRLLVACDFDGVIAPIVDDPAEARPLARTLAALKRLTEIERTDSAVISGRDVDALRTLMGDFGPLVVIGNHGAQESHQRAPELDPERAASLKSLAAALERIGETIPGVIVERKRTGVAFHYRRAGLTQAGRAADLALGEIARYPEGRLIRGQMVLEVQFTSADKGTALKGLRYALGSTAVVFIGDDVTDDDAFAVMGETDLSVAVGPVPARATFRVESPQEAGELLEKLAEARSAATASLRHPPIERHAMLSDQRTLALVDPAGTVNWLCFPRADSSTIFASLLDGERAGCFSIRPEGEAEPERQEYVGDSLILRTRWKRLTVTDYLDCSQGRPFQRAGRSDLVRVVEGEGRFRVSFTPRPDFGRVKTRLRVEPAGIEVEGTPDPVVLYAPGIEWEVIDDNGCERAEATIELNGTPVVFQLRYGSANLREAILDEPSRRSQTQRFWSAWVGSLTLLPLAKEAVKRSAIILKALVHGPTGAILAAGTTSLPEWPGGVRNWDYRYCWIRDAALSAAALVRLGNTGQAMRFLDWMLGVLDQCESPERLRPLYKVSGGELGPEAEISELTGYQCSRPVRVGNAASQHVQLDVFGTVVDLISLMAEKGAPVSNEHWRLAEAMVLAVQRRWHEPDHGIWEIRTDRRHHVHSKTLCWLTVDRACTLSEQLHGRKRPEWCSMRDEIAADVLEHGYNAKCGAFTAAYGAEDLDAAALLIGLSGLLPPSDRRFVSTVEAVEKHLRDGPTVYRYRRDDGIAGSEGGFHICTGWMIEAYLAIGRRKDAAELFEQLVALCGPTGLLAEQYDPARRQALGNFPQAYSHLAIINAADALSRA